jgi:hypothetical protein
MDKLTDIKQITDESLKAGEVQASVITDFIENQLQEASEKFVEEKQEVETKLKAAEEAQVIMTSDFEGIKKELEEIKEAQATKAAEDLFNQRMAAFDTEYELDDEHRSIIASDIKDMNEEDFDSYAKKMEVLLSRQKYGGNKGDIPDADRKKDGHHGRGPKRKETAKEEGEEDFKKDMKATEETTEEVAEEVVASIEETQEAASVLDEAMENADVDNSQIPATSEASESTVLEKYKQAFNLDKFEIDY